MPNHLLLETSQAPRQRSDVGDENMNQEPSDMDYWRFINLAGRFVGWLFLLGGIVGGLSCLPLLLDPDASINNNGVATSDPAIKAIGPIMFFGGAGLGLLLLKARPFYPPEIRKWMEQQKANNMLDGTRRPADEALQPPA